MTQENQTDLFDLRAGEERQEVGAARVERGSPQFVATMRLIAITISNEKGEVTSDDLREIAMERNLRPSHPNAWGAIFRANGWRVIDRRKSRLASNHAREIKVWRWEG